MQYHLFAKRRTAVTIVATAGLFPVIVVALNLLQRAHYSPVRQAISELALGRGGTAMILAFCSLGAGIFLLGRLIRHTVAGARIAPILLSVAAVFAGPISAAFHTDRTGANATWHGNIHNLAGLAAFLLILISMALCSYRFRNDPTWRPFAAPTAGWTALAIATFVLIPALGNADFGLAQRLFIASFIAWIIHSGLFARRVPSPDASTASATPALTAGASGCHASPEHAVNTRST